MQLFPDKRQVGQLDELLLQNQSDFFANGAAQCHARLHGGTVHPGLLLSNGTAIIAMRGHALLPFEVSEIESLFQTDEDQSPTTRSGWEFFDKWNA